MRFRLGLALRCLLLIALGQCLERRAAAQPRSIDAVAWRAAGMDRMGRFGARRLDPYDFTLHAPEFLQRGPMMRALAQWSLSPDPIIGPCPSCGLANERGLTVYPQLSATLSRFDPQRLISTDLYPLRRDKLGRPEQVAGFFPSLAIMPLIGRPAYGLAAVGTF